MGLDVQIAKSQSRRFQIAMKSHDLRSQSISGSEAKFPLHLWKNREEIATEIALIQIAAVSRLSFVLV